MHFLMEYPAIAVYLASLQISLLETDFDKKKEDRSVSTTGATCTQGRLGGAALRPSRRIGRHIWNRSNPFGLEQPFLVPISNSAYFPSAAQTQTRAAQSQTGGRIVNMTRVGGRQSIRDFFLKRPKAQGSVTRKLGVSVFIKNIEVIHYTRPTRPKHLPGSKQSARFARSQSRRKIPSVVSSSMDRGMNGIARQCRIYNQLWNFQQ